MTNKQPDTDVPSSVAAYMEKPSTDAHASVSDTEVPKPFTTENKSLKNRVRDVPPPGVLLNDKATDRIVGDVEDGFVRVSVDHWRVVYPNGSQRPSYFLVHSAGELIPLIGLQRITE